MDISQLNKFINRTNLSLTYFTMQLQTFNMEEVLTIQTTLQFSWVMTFLAHLHIIINLNRLKKIFCIIRLTSLSHIPFNSKI